MSVHPVASHHKTCTTWHETTSHNIIWHSSNIMTFRDQPQWLSWHPLKPHDIVPHHTRPHQITTRNPKKNATKTPFFWLISSCSPWNFCPRLARKLFVTLINLDHQDGKKTHWIVTNRMSFLFWKGIRQKTTEEEEITVIVYFPKNSLVSPKNHHHAPHNLAFV